MIGIGEILTWDEGGEDYLRVSTVELRELWRIRGGVNWWIGLSEENVVEAFALHPSGSLVESLSG
jgi:hypothetical protein